MADWGDSFVQGLGIGSRMAESGLDREFKERQLVLAKQKANVDIWGTIVKSLDLPATQRGFAINQLWRANGGDTNDPSYKDFSKLIASEDAATIESMRNLVAGAGEDIKNIPMTVLTDPKQFKEVIKLVEKGREQRETKEILGNMQAEISGQPIPEKAPADKPMPASLTGQQTAAPKSGAVGDATGVVPPVTESEVAGTKAGVTGAAPTTTMRQPVETGQKGPNGFAVTRPMNQDEAKKRAIYDKYTQTAIQLIGAGNEKAGQMIQAQMKEFAKTAWTERFENDHLVRRNSITGEVQSVYQRPEYKNSKPIYNPETNVLMGYEVSSSRGGKEFKPALEQIKEVPILGPPDANGNREVIAIRNQNMTKGGSTISNLPETATSESIPGGGVRQRTSTGKTSFAEPNETFAPVAADDPVGQKLQQQNPRAVVVKGSRGGYKIEGEKGPEGEIRYMKDGTPYAVQPGGTITGLSTKTEYPPGTKEAATQSVKRLGEMEKNVDALGKMVSLLDKANTAAKAGSDKGAYQAIVRQMQALAAPIVGADTIKNLGPAEVFNALRVQAGLSGVSEVSDRPNIYQTKLMMEAAGSETLSPEARQTLRDVQTSELGLLRKLYGRAVVFNDKVGSLYGLDESGRSWQDVVAQETEAWQSTDAYKKLEERLANVQPQKTAIRTGVRIEDMNPTELENYMNSDGFAKASVQEVARAKRRATQLKQQEKK